MLLLYMMLLPGLASCAAVTPISPSISTPVFTQTPVPTSTSTPTLEPTLTPTATKIPTYCGALPTMFILLIGSDARSNTYTIGLADSIRIVRLDFKDPSIQVLTFQRDLYVEIPGIEDYYGITHGKLNQAFLYGNPGYGHYDGPGQGPGLTALTLEQNFGVQVDHYVAVNLKVFQRVVDGVGGIDIILPYTVDGRVKGSKDSDRYFPAGKQHLNGYRTMLLARMRPLGDFQRSDVQNLILQALAEKLYSPSVIPKLPGLIKTFIGSVQTDLGAGEVAQLICLARIINTQDIQYVSFPENLFEGGRVQDPVLGNTYILKADFDVLKKYVQLFNNGSTSEFKVSPTDGTSP